MWQGKRIPRRLPADAGDGAAAGRAGVRDGKGPGAGPGDVPGRVLHYADGEHGHIHQPGPGNEWVHRGTRQALEIWVGDIGPDACHKRIDEVWNRR